jgi:hypothetical protein
LKRRPGPAAEGAAMCVDKPAFGVPTKVRWTMNADELFDTLKHMFFTKGGVNQTQIRGNVADGLYGNRSRIESLYFRHQTWRLMAKMHGNSHGRC